MLNYILIKNKFIIVLKIITLMLVPTNDGVGFLGA